MRAHLQILLVCATLQVATCAAPPVQAAEPASRSYKIAPQPVVTALKAFAAQSDLQLIFTEADVGHAETTGVTGTRSPRAALAEILKGTGLEFEFTANNVVVVRKMAAQPAAVRTSANTAGAPDKSVRLAQADNAEAAATTATAADSTERGSQSELGKSSDNLDEVVITGSHIRGARNDTAPLLTFDREYIERSGYTNMMQLVDSLPMDFKGGSTGASETAAFGLSANSGQNLTRGTGFNLHGLGSVATLTLIDGRRVAPSGEGQFVDVSTIPLSAVERVEILPDGASAIYGADAVAGVVNIILRKNFNGAETNIDYGQATRGGTGEERLSQTLGKSWSSGSALLVADINKRDPLDGRDRDYIVAAGGAQPLGPTYLLPKRITESLVFNANQNLPGNFDLFTDVMYSHEEEQQALTDVDGVEVSNNPHTNKYSFVLGVGYRPFGDWRFELSGSGARASTITDFTYTYLQTGELLLLINDYHDIYETWAGDFKGDGSLFSLPAGKVRLAVGGTYRSDNVNSTRIRVIPATGLQVRAIENRHQNSFYGELFVPLVSKEQGFSWTRRIDLSVAVRHDDYSDFGSTTNPKVGLVWSPIESLDLRASYGTSFRAPTLQEKGQVTRGLQISTDSVDDPAGGPEVPIFYLVGAAPLTAEKSKDTSVGFTLRPEALKGFEFSFNYWDIDYTGRISMPPFDAGVLSRRSDYGSLITPIANDAAALAYLNSAIAAGDIFLDFAGTGATGVRYVFDLREQNSARDRTNGFDIAGNYAFRVGGEGFDVDLNLTHINKILTSLTDNTTPFNQVNTFEMPLKTRVRALGTWTHGGMSSTLAINWSNAYTNTSLAVDEPIKAWTTVDLNLSYDFGNFAHYSILNGTKLSMSVSNLFDVNPPRATDALYNMGFDVFNGDAMGRYIIGRLSKRW